MSQDDAMVGMTNPGQFQQHYLQEAQLYSQARPGPQQEQLLQDIPISAEEFRIFHHQQLDAQIDCIMRAQMAQHYEENQRHFVKIERTRSNPEPREGVGFVEMSQDNPIVMPPGVMFAPIDYIQHCHAMGGPASSQGDAFGDESIMSLQTNCYMPPQRPFTPPTQVNMGELTMRSLSQDHAKALAAFFPATPAATPFSMHGDALIQLQHENQQAEAYSQSQSPDSDLTGRGRQMHSRPGSQIYHSVSPNRVSSQAQEIMRSAHQQHFTQPGLQAPFLDMPTQLGQESLPSPPNTAPMRASRKFDVAMMPHALDAVPELRFIPVRPDALMDDGLQFGDGVQHGLELSSVRSSPIQHYHDSSLSSINHDLSVGGSSPFRSARSSVDYGQLGSPERGQLSPGTMSIADLSLETTIEDTGISAEEVQAFIGEQDMISGKWTCLFPECGKVFGRKENIRSHVQTHLGDRQYRCVHCQKRFVRQHDLKRHSKIHSGVKPYPCRCGNSFARHDALTRHRQRGICDGGFEGVVKKIVKRGRPRKERSADDGRADKASMSRQKAAAKSYASSVCGSSENGSMDESPGSPSGFSAESESSQKTMQQSEQATQAGTVQVEDFAYTPPHSPYSTGDKPSPTKVIRSMHSASMPASPSSPAEDNIDMMAHALLLPLKVDQAPILSLAHASQICIQADSPPGLSHSSPPSSARVRDLEMESLGTFPALAARLKEEPDIEVEGGRPESSAADVDTNPDFDMFGVSAGEGGPSMYGGEWDETAYFSFDKDASNNALRIDGFGPTLEDDVLFSDLPASEYSW